MLTALVIIAAPLVLAAVTYAARSTRGRPEHDRRREAIDERRAAANLTPERRLDVFPMNPPARPGRHE